MNLSPSNNNSLRLRKAGRRISRCAGLLVLLLMGLVLCVPATGSAMPDDNDGLLELKSPRKPFIRGYRMIVDEEGDTIPLFYLNTFVYYPKLKFKNKKDEEFYWRTVRDVRRTLPYAKLIGETLIETYEYIETFPTQKEREAYLKQMEKSIFKQYKPIMRKFTKNQAKTLIKLIQRETHQSGYEIVKAFLGGFRATFWQGFGKLFGVSLKGKYEPEKNHQDAIIERVATNIEQGLL